jgi:tetratricopeptide (TPR) repeat protein
LVLLASDAGDLTRARELGEECLRLWERCGDAERSAGARSLLAGVARDAGDLEQAEALYEQSLAQFRQAKEPWGTAQIIRGLGLVVLARGDYARAYRLGEECLAMNQQLGNGRGISQALKLMGDAALQLGQLEEADRRCQEALERLRARGFEPDIRAAQRSAATVALAQGDVRRAASLLDPAGTESADLLLLAVTRIREGRPDEAAAILDDTERRAKRNHDVGSEAAVLEARAEAAVVAGTTEAAARWLTEAAAKREAAGVVLTPTEAADHERTVVALSLVLAGRTPRVVAGEEVSIDLRDPIHPDAAAPPTEGRPEGRRPAVPG